MCLQMIDSVPPKSPNNHCHSKICNLHEKSCMASVYRAVCCGPDVRVPSASQVAPLTHVAAGGAISIEDFDFDLVRFQQKPETPILRDSQEVLSRIVPVAIGRDGCVDTMRRVHSRSAITAAIYFASCFFVTVLAIVEDVSYGEKGCISALCSSTAWLGH